jgi:hypothetical protein
VAERLVPCGGCSRHVLCSESACPFCGVAVLAGEAPRSRELFRRMAAAAAVAAGVTALTGCASGEASVPLHGVPGVPGDASSSRDASSPDDSAAIGVGSIVSYYGGSGWDDVVVSPVDADVDAPADGPSSADAEAGRPESG